MPISIDDCFLRWKRHSVLPRVRLYLPRYFKRRERNQSFDPFKNKEVELDRNFVQVYSCTSVACFFLTDTDNTANIRLSVTHLFVTRFVLPVYLSFLWKIQKSVNIKSRVMANRIMHYYTIVQDKWGRVQSKGTSDCSVYLFSKPSNKKSYNSFVMEPVRTSTTKKKTATVCLVKRKINVSVPKYANISFPFSPSLYPLPSRSLSPSTVWFSSKDSGERRSFTNTARGKNKEDVEISFLSPLPSCIVDEHKQWSREKRERWVRVHD